MLTMTVKERKQVAYELSLTGPETDEMAQDLRMGVAIGPRNLRDDLPLPATPQSIALVERWASDHNVQVWMTARTVAWATEEAIRLRSLQDPPTFGRTGLYPFQNEGVAFLNANADYNNGFIRCLIADDPRLGKSIQALCALEDVDGPILILTLKPLVHQWLEYVRTWLPQRQAIAILRYTAQERCERLERVLEYDNPVVITNWETLHMQVPIKDVRWSAVIGDEAHKLKSRPKRERSYGPEAKSQIAYHFRDLKAGHMMLLSGTFVEKTPADWWQPLSMLRKEVFGSYWTWLSWFVKTRDNGYGVELVGPKNASLMQKTMAPYVLRRRAEDVADMPEIVEEDLVVEMPPDHKGLYRALKKKTIIELQSGELDIPSEAVRIMRLRQMTTHPALLEPEYWKSTSKGKFDTLKTLVSEMIPEDEQIIVYSSFVDGCILASDTTGGEVYAGDIADPSTITRFTSGDTRILCATPGKGGVGLNLYNANYVIYLDRPWSTIQWRQSRDRAVAIGKKHSIMVYTIVLEDSIDEYVVKTLIRKMKMVTESDVIMNVKRSLVLQ